MKLIVGLGNPGEKYTNTRHNVGFHMVNRLSTIDDIPAGWTKSTRFKAEICSIKKHSVVLAKPQTFMNESGVSVGPLSAYYHILPTNIYVVHDDLDIKLGDYKIQLGVGPKVHGGVSSIENTLGTINFWRVRIGVDNRDPLNRVPGEKYVLEKFTNDEMTVLNKTVDLVAEDMISALSSHISTLKS